MKAFQLGESNGIDALHVVEVPVPTVSTGQVLVRIRAASVNYKDLFVARGIPSRPSRRLVPLSDGAGEVVDIGPGVTRVKVGDRVTPIVAQSWIGGGMTADLHQSVLGGGVDGVLTEYVVLSQQGVVTIPSNLSFEEAATLPCAAATAWNALVRIAGVKPGDTVLVQGSGGVSIFALQFAKLLGAGVIALSSSDNKLARMRDLGAFATINYRTNPDWDNQVLQITGGRGVDHVVEVAGSATLAKSFRAVCVGGTVVFVGVLGGLQGTVDPLPVLTKALRLVGCSVGPRDVVEEMNRAIAQQDMHPVIDRIFPFEQGADALRYLESGAHFGKIVVRV